MEYPLTAHNLAALWPRYNGVYSHALKGLLFLLASHFPLHGIRPFHGFGIRAWVIGLVKFCQVGMDLALSIGRYLIAWVIIFDRCACGPFGVYDSFGISCLYSRVNDSALVWVPKLVKYHVA